MAGRLSYRVTDGEYRPQRHVGGLKGSLRLSCGGEFIQVRWGRGGEDLFLLILQTPH